MSYITSCPKCDTHFLLNKELIKAHRGKVQCGSCGHVFNAKNRLTEVPDDITSADEYQASLENDTFKENEAETNETTLLEEAISETDNYIGEFSSTIDPSAEPKAAPKSTVEIVAPPILDDFTSNRGPHNKTSKHIALLSILSVLLIVAAALQTIYFMRVKIAAEYPQYKPLLVNACAQLNCTIDLPKNLDLITIGDSDMQEDDIYLSVINFSSSLKNNANYPQAYPNIELTLTNANDKAVIRKLIRPKEYLASDIKIEDGLNARETKPVKLALYVNEALVAGYRILLIY